MLQRLEQVEPLARTMPMVPAATVSREALRAVDRHLARGRRGLRRAIEEFRDWLRGRGQAASPEDAQQRFVALRMRFHGALAQFDIFADVFTQRSEHDYGVLLAGLDALADDALRIPGVEFDAPALMCYLDRGFGAAIRRAETRLPGGGQSPVAIVRVPRERMVGSSVASSLVHEVGHQGAALLDLVSSLERTLDAWRARRARLRGAWGLWRRWLSEIVPDLWSVSRLGVVATRGLMSVVSLPRRAVFRIDPDNPHPTPWLRVQVSCAFGNALAPDPQWDRLAQLWRALYPLHRSDSRGSGILGALQSSLRELVDVVLDDRPRLLAGATVREALTDRLRRPAALLALHDRWNRDPRRLRDTPPTLAVAVLGQAGAVDRVSPEDEGRTLFALLRRWALRRASEEAPRTATAQLTSVVRTRTVTT
jgi:hypothetical protein